MEEEITNNFEEPSSGNVSVGPLRVVRSEQIRFLSSVPVEMRQQVEDLFFFNLHQRKFSRQIQETVAKTGAPRLHDLAGRITITLPSEHAQCLFACDEAETPIACALYSRPASDLIWVSYVATDPECAFLDLPRAGITAVLMEKILEIARSIRGVTRVQLPFRKESFLPVQRPSLTHR